MVQSDNVRRQVHLDATGVDLPRTLDVTYPYSCLLV
jgi:hypothetical protein